ncbi:MAG: phosphate signaling complex protein PhoU [candidate division NC10 bacterium]|nr:phosphate signaling complex protein PhoU [candidate division NC10 bacterium]
MLRSFEAELRELKELLLAMGGLAETMIQESVQALVERNAEKAQAVFRYEEEMDQRCIDLDDRSFKLLALSQPVASDLRFIAAGIKINSELERIGDLAVNISVRTLTLLKEPPIHALVDIPKMMQLAQEMVKRSLDAFVTRNPDLARAVIESDDAIDHLRDRFVQELTTLMGREPEAIPAALNMVLIARNLERIADHATNIAEDVIYIVRGEDVRERGDKEIRKGIRRRDEAPKVPLVLPAEGPIARALQEETELFGLFREVAINVLAGAKALREMFEQYRNPRAQWEGIEELERRGDELTHRIVRRLNETFITLLDRVDLHALTSRLDDVLDGIEAVASRMVLYRIPEPTPQARELVGLIVASAEQIVEAMNRMPRFADVEKVCVELNRLENLADNVYRGAIAALFDGNRPAADLIKWKEIYELLEATTDRSEDVADVVEGIALKRRVLGF